MTDTGAEKHFHIVFAAKRVNGEWFNLSEADVLAFTHHTFLLFPESQG